MKQPVRLTDVTVWLTVTLNAGMEKSTVPSPACYLEEQSHLCKPSGILPGIEPAGVSMQHPQGRLHWGEQSQECSEQEPSFSQHHGICQAPNGMVAIRGTEGPRVHPFTVKLATQLNLQLNSATHASHSLNEKYTILN